MQKGIVGLDEPIMNHVPHIDALPLISRAHEGSDSEFIVRKPSKPITLRHLLTYTAGLDTPQNDLVQEYLSKNDLGVPEGAPNLVKMFSIPLLFEPGEGFLYGSCIYWMQHLVGTIGGNFQDYVKEHILNPLGMSTATYVPDKVPEVWAKKLRMVEKVDGKFVPHDEHSRGFTCSVLDMAKLLSELISSNPKLLKKEYHDLLVTGQLEPGGPAQTQLYEFEETYGFAGSKSDDPDVNWTAGGAVITKAGFTKTGMPPGTVTWDGGFGTPWAVNREKGRTVFFATQMLPYEAFQDVAQTFMQSAWATFT